MKKNNRYVPTLSLERPQGQSLTEQGLALSVPEIFRKMVLGELPNYGDIQGEYDDEDSSGVDPLNVGGLTLEEYNDLQEANTEYLKSVQNSSTPPKKDSEQKEPATPEKVEE